MIKNFSTYLVEEEREVYFTFGRMNPPTIGHGKVMEVLAKKSGKSDYKVFLSQSQNAKKDPLSFMDKIKHTRKMFPKHARNIILDKDIKTVFDIAVKLYDQGYKKINMVVGSDRVREFEVLLNKYNGEKARHGFYNFQSINILSAGARDPDATGVEGMSASKQRENATNNDFVTFSQGVPKEMSDKDTRKLFNDVRKGMGLKEEHSFKNHVDLGTISETREQYRQGELFAVGDEVVIKETDELANIAVLGTNYVIVEANGKKMRKWLDAIELVEKQDPDIKDREGTQPARYHAGLKKSTKAKRDAHFKAKKDGPAPGDATAKTKPSKYTKQFKDMYEEVSQKELDDLEKFGDRLLNKFDVDIEFTRHFKDRMNDKRNKPAITVDELENLFKKMADNKGKKIKKHGNSEAILKDMQSDLNLPVVINWKNGEFEVVNKTIMRKKAFKSPDPQLKYESVELDESSILKSIVDKIGPKTWQKNQYKQATDVVKKIIARKKDERKKAGESGLAHSSTYYAQQVLKTYRNVGLDPKILGKMADMAETNLNEADAIDSAKDKIEREKNADKKKHDRILDRARLLSVKKKNRETK